MQVATPIEDLGSDLSPIEVEPRSLSKPPALNSLPPLGDGRGLDSCLLDN